MDKQLTLSPDLVFSFCQFTVQDLIADEILEGFSFNITERHCDQGFSRLESVATFNTLEELGSAEVTITEGKFDPSDTYNRVITVPFTVVTGQLVVVAPEDMSDERLFKLAPGFYLLTVAQRAIDEDREVIDLYFESLVTQAKESRIIVADDYLRPVYPLLESVGLYNYRAGGTV
jgi:hypothetical protein